MEENQNQNKASFFNQLSPKAALVVGLVGGLLVLCAIGFFILLGIMLKGRSADIYQAVPTTGAPTAAPDAAPTGTVPPLSKDDYILGDKNAPLTLIAYTDFECPFCKRFHDTVKQVRDNYAGKVKIVFRHYPLSFHANAQKEAEAAECIGEQGGSKAFYAYADKIFERTTSNGYGFALDKLGALAAEVGVNQSKFQTCLDSGKYASRVTDQMNAGASAGVQGTPGSFLVDKDGNAQLISGAVPYEQIKAAIDAKL
ncbi:MAG: thioredoxin domain-containing protein [Candidatus Magasanikbacteria bacterium]|nr:thioredoxin domain-containing protein [Candidatus Magasanikbacteria bacterium]